MLIYKLMFSSGKSYIGQTVRTLQTRITQHRQSVRLGSLLAVHCAWREHGDPEVTVLCVCATQEETHEAERRLIDEHGTMSPNGYNISHGGDTAPSKSPMVAAKISAKALGRQVSEETRQVIGSRSKASWATDEYREKVGSAIKRAYENPEVRQRHSSAVKAAWQKKVADGWEMPEEQRAKLAGRKFSERTRQRMSESAKKRVHAPRSEETCRKIAENTRRQHASMTPEQKAAHAQKIRDGKAARKARQEETA